MIIKERSQGKGRAALTAIAAAGCAAPAAPGAHR